VKIKYLLLVLSKQSSCDKLFFTLSVTLTLLPVINRWTEMPQKNYIISLR